MKTAFLKFFRRLHARRVVGILSSCLVTAAAFLACMVFDAAESRYALQRDYSFNGAATQHKVTTEQLTMLQRDVHVYVVTSQGNQDNTLLSLLTRYQAVTPRFTFSQERISQNPALLTAFEDVLSQAQVDSDCLIVHCKDTGRSRVLKAEDFITYEYDSTTGYYVATGVNYDKPLTEAIVFCAQPEPLTVQLLRGHGEVSGEDLQVITNVLTRKNYHMQEVNLLSGDTLRTDAPLLILCPKLDLSALELSLLMAFADQGGDFFIISDYTDPLDNPNYNAFLRTYGISFYQGLVMAEPDDRQSYYDETPAFLMPRMTEGELTQPLIESGRDTLLLPGSRAIRLPETLSQGVSVETLLVSGKAYVRDYVAAAPDDTAKQPTDPEGYFALSVLSSRVSEAGKVSRAMVTGNAEMFTHWWVEENTYSADYLLRGLAYLQGESPISLDISGKTGVRAPLTLYSLTPLIAVITLLPLLVLALALWVLVPRRHL